MADAADIALVRVNTNEPVDEEPFTDAYIGGLIDASDVSAASATIWRQKAAVYAEMADVQEAGASIKFSDLYKQALAMASSHEPTVPVGSTSLGNARTHQIFRTT